MTQKAKAIFAALAKRDAKFASIMPPEAVPVVQLEAAEEAGRRAARKPGDDLQKGVPSPSL
jgi:hypothetical protein